MTPSYLNEFIESEWEKASQHIWKPKQKNVILNIVKRSYSESHRYYHTLEHIASCLRLLNKVIFEADNEELPWDYSVLKLAIWFHDIIYDTKSKNNEENSADLAYALLFSSDIQLAQQVSNLILLTKHENLLSANNMSIEEKLLLDIDLSILGSDEDHFAKYEYEIRQEYQYVSDDDYNKARISLLSDFLNRNRIYNTEFFKKNFQGRAMLNIAKSLERFKINSIPPQKI